MNIPLTYNPISRNMVKAIGGLVYTDFTLCGNKLGLVAKSTGSLRLHYSDDYEVKRGALLLLAGQIACVVGFIALPYIFSIKATLLGWTACGFALKHINLVAINTTKDLLLKALQPTIDEPALTYYDKIYAVWKLVTLAYSRRRMLNLEIVVLRGRCRFEYMKFQKFFQTSGFLSDLEIFKNVIVWPDTEERKQIDGEVAAAIEFYGVKRS